jgi:hypothetical protein
MLSMSWVWPNKDLSGSGEMTRNSRSRTKLEGLRACLASDGEPTSTETCSIIGKDN